MLSFLVARTLHNGIGGEQKRHLVIPPRPNLHDEAVLLQEPLGFRASGLGFRV